MVLCEITWTPPFSLPLFAGPGGDTREGSSGMGSSRFFFVYIMVLCEITWTPPFSLPLFPFRLSRPFLCPPPSYLLRLPFCPLLPLSLPLFPFRLSRPFL